MWRHPAELADAARNDSLATTPPLGRRLLALTAAVSLVASVAVLFIAVPKGISEYTDTEVTATTQQSLRIKGSLTPALAVANGSKGATTAVSLGTGIWIVASDSVDTQDPIWITLENGEVIEALTTSVSDKLALLSQSPNAKTQMSIEWDSYLSPNSMADLKGFRIVDIHGTHRLGHEQSIRLLGDVTDVPLTTETQIEGVAAVIDKNQNVVGVASMSHHGCWFVSKESLISLVKQHTSTAP